MQEVNLTQINNYYNAEQLYPIRPQQDINQLLADLFKSFANLFDSLGSGQFNNPSSFPGCGCTSPPVMEDSSHPSGSLKTDGNVITTTGGYTIEPMSKFEWKITGPDGKSTRVWGDPHVAESDGGKWDFKRNSTFMLPDGTRINVTTAPWGNSNMTVTSQLEVISGNDRVLVTDIDKGKGKIGQITSDGYQHANSFGGNDVFVMGKETDDWSYKGREIIGSNNGGESFKLGNDLAPGVSNGSSSARSMIDQILDRFLGPGWEQRFSNARPDMNPYYNPTNWNNNTNYDPSQHQQRMADAFKALSDMFDALSRLMGMNDSLYASRNRSIAV